ncbi:hypothetical protein ACFQL1_13515 [Halomicroarcula sp. GCM10025709]|uniref:hypothetical protein n=1 Tax=Haloarcula TaxID=2237 RepID=UPI0024C408FE|nr:hypothetical protein [Halomicroarcula sp. YJ-61-S]
MRRPTARRVGLVARTELRRTWRNLRESTRGILLLLLGGAGLAVYSLVGAGGAFFVGRAMVGGEFDAARLAMTGLTVGLFGLVAFSTGQHAVKRTAEPDALDGLLTTAPAADILGGVLVAELLRVLAALAVPLLALTGGLAVGTGSVAVAVVVPAVLFPLLVLGTVVGLGVGLLVKLLVGQVAFVARHRGSVGTVASLVLACGWVLVWTTQSAQAAALEAVTASPLSWLADVLLLAVPGVDADPLAAATAVGVLLASVPVGVAALLWLAERVWYADPIQPDHEFDSDDRRLSDRLLSGWVPRATRVVAQKSWLRARRAPITVQFALVPVFLLVFQLQTVIFDGTVPPTLPLAAGLASGATAGAAFTLNPLGGEEGVLPLTLTANVSGRAFVGGLVLAGALPGLVGVAVSVVGFGVAAGVSPLAVAVALTAGLLVTVSAPAIAAGAGVVFPKFESSSVRGREVVVPSTWAFALYAAALVVAVAPVSGAYLAVVGTPFPVAVAPAVTLVGGLLGTAVLAGGGALAGFYYAGNRVATYRLD